MPFAPRFRLLALAALAVAPHASRAQGWTGDAGEPVVTGWITNQDGLSSYAVTTLLVDPDGYLWVGTVSGLNRFDGHTLRTFYSGATALPDNYVTLQTLHASARGGLWVGTNRGLAHLDRETGAGLDVIDDACELKDYYITGVLPSRTAGGVVIGSMQGAFVRYGDGCPEPVPLDDALSPFVGTVVEARDGTLWIGTASGLGRYDARRRRVVVAVGETASAAARALATAQVYAVSEGAGGVLWVGTYGHGLFRFDPRSGTVEQYTHGAAGSLPHDQVLSVLVDSRGDVWVGTMGAGLARLRGAGAQGGPRGPSPATFSVYTARSGDRRALPDDRVTSLAEGADGTLWAGTWRGVARIERRPPFRILRPEPARTGSLGHSDVRAIAEMDGALWVGTDGGGLHRVDDRTGVAIPVLPRDEAIRAALATVTALWADPRGELWIGTTAGLVRYDPATSSWSRYLPRKGDPGAIAGDHLYDLLGDSQGGLWVGTFGQGLDHFDPATGSFTHLRLSEATGSVEQADLVWALSADGQGGLWVGTFGGGLFHLLRPPRAPTARPELQRYENAPHDPTSLSHNRVIALAPAGGRELWVGTDGGGLDLLNTVTGHVRHVTPAHGLPDLSVGCVLPDGRGAVWASTPDGLVRIGADGALRTYREGDGLPSAAFMEGACLRGRDGTLYFGGIGGLVAIRPDDAAWGTRPAPPPVVVTGATVFGHPRALGRERRLVLAYPENAVTFDFAAIDFASPSNTQYAFRLVGLDERWERGGDRRSVSYYNIPPGSYTFRVAGAGGAGVWNADGATVHLVVLPPWWATWWFRTLVALSVVLGAVLAYRARVRYVVERSMREARREMELEQVRRRLAADLHDNIGSGISGIALEIEAQARFGGPPSPERLLEFSGRTRAIVDAVRETIWLAGKEHDHLRDFVEKLQGAATPLLLDRAHSFRWPDPLPDITVGPEERRYIKAATLEVLHNAHRYSEASRIDVSLRFDAKAKGLVVEVVDDGVGFDVEAARAAGRGLHSLIERVEAAGGRVEIASAPGSGSRVTLWFPLGGMNGGEKQGAIKGGGRGLWHTLWGRWRRRSAAYPADSPKGENPGGDGVSPGGRSRPG